MTIQQCDFPTPALRAPAAQLPSPIATLAPIPTPAPALSDDARLYLRHVEGGESIRALAREAGLHASTVMRRIRRFEARRDDPLIDSALNRHEGQGSMAGAGVVAAADAVMRRRHEGTQTRRILRRLAESGAEMVVAADMDKAIVVRDGIRTAILDRRLAEQIALSGWVAAESGGRLRRYAITSAGRAALRDMLRGGALPRPEDFFNASPVAIPGTLPPGTAPDASEDADTDAGDDPGPAEAGRHRLFESRTIRDPASGTRRRARINIAESPLLVLARRKGRDGQPFLSPDMVRAGERLREDFELAHLGPRVAQNWERFLTAGVHAGFGPSSGGSDSARDRVALALRDLGPGMGDLVLRVCCYLEGIEMTERRLGWSARSGKVVMRLALMRLHQHYLETYGPGSPLIG